MVFTIYWTLTKSRIKGVWLGKPIWHNLMQQFPVAAGTNYHQLGGLKQEEFFSHRRLRSRCWQGHAPSRDSQGDSFLAVSSFWQLWTFLALWPLIPIKPLSSHGLLFPHVFSALSTWTIQNDLILTSLASLQLHRSSSQRRLHSQFPGCNVSSGELSFRSLPVMDAKRYKEPETLVPTLTWLCFTEM